MSAGRSAMLKTTTPLGRSVLISNWKAYHRDVVLKFLWGVYIVDRQADVAKRELVRATGLDQTRADQVASTLTDKGLAKETRPNLFRLLPAGAKYVRATRYYRREFILDRPSRVSTLVGMRIHH